MVYSALLGFVGWTFVPNAVTQQALKFVLQFYPRLSAGRPPPSPGSPAYVQLYRYTYAVVVLGYLIYTLISGARHIGPNFYENLGVSPDVDDNGLKLAFRQFAKRFHPDRVGSQGAELFMQTRDAFEALKNPTVRFAYDRFGPDVLQWNQLSTTREYLRHGLLQSVGYHIATIVGLLLFSAVGKQNPVKFWRYILYLVFFASELAYILYPSPSSLSIFASAFWDPKNNGTSPTLLHMLFPQRVAYQHILFLHQMFLFMSFALTKVVPMLFPDSQRDEQQQVLQQISKLAAYSDVEASIILHTALQSIHPATPTTRISTVEIRPVSQPSADVIDLLAVELENMIIESKVKQDTGPLRSAGERAIIRERTRSEASPAQLVIIENNHDGNLPSPLSACEGEGKLPSPRPSPPPATIPRQAPPPVTLRRNSSYVRARSVSWS